MNMFDIIRLSAETTETQEVSGLTAFFYQYGSIIMLVLVFVVMYFLMIRPQQKKQKEEQKMRNNLRVGDELTTIGGVCGRVISIKDDTVTIESSVDRTKMQFKKWAVQSVDTKHDDPVDDDDDDDDI